MDQVSQGGGYARPSGNVQSPAISTDTTRPYTAMIPDITTGINDWK
jgi:hypothetical protein